MVPPQLTNPHKLKIAVLRTGALGDMMVALPALDALRKYYPLAELVLLTDHHTATYTSEGRFPVDRILELPPLKGICPNGFQEWSMQSELVQSLQQESFDLLLNMQGRGIASNPFVQACKASINIGFSSGDAFDGNTSRYSYFQSEVIRLWELSKLAGAETFDPDAAYEPTKSDRASISSLLGEASPFIVISPFSTDVRRNWPTPNFLPVIRFFQTNTINVILTGTNDQKNEIDQLNIQSGYYCTVLAGSLQITQLAALLQRASMVIAPDTGTLHLARSVQTPTVGLYWAPNVINWGPLTRNRHAVVISWDLYCPLCYSIPINPFPFEPQSACTHEISFIRNLRPEQVIDEIKRLLHFTPIQMTI